MLNTQIGRLTMLLIVTSLGLVAANAQEPTYDEQLQSAKTLLSRYRYDEALKGFKRANEMHDKKSNAMH